MNWPNKRRKLKKMIYGSDEARVKKEEKSAGMNRKATKRRDRGRKKYMLQKKIWYKYLQ